MASGTYQALQAGNRAVKMKHLLRRNVNVSEKTATAKVRNWRDTEILTKAVLKEVF